MRSANFSRSIACLKDLKCHLFINTPWNEMAVMFLTIQDNRHMQYTYRTITEQTSYMDRHIVKYRNIHSLSNQGALLTLSDQEHYLELFSYFFSQTQNILKNLKGFYSITVQKITCQLNALTQKIKPNYY